MQKKKRVRKSKRIELDSIYYAARKEYFDIMHDASQAYDKAIVSLSTAALGFICGLMIYKAPLHFHCIFFALVSGWLFICSIAFELNSLWLRQDYSEKGIYDLNKKYKSDYKISPPKVNSRVAIEMVIAQKCSGCCFVFALLALMFFVAINCL